MSYTGKMTSDTSGQPTFRHRSEVLDAKEQLFELFQLSDPEIRRGLFASLLLRNTLVLLSGTYGTGKTQFVRLVAELLFGGEEDEKFAYETCHQDLTVLDALYHLDLAELQQGREVVHPKNILTARLKFFNEIQRAGSSFFNALLPLFAEQRVTYRDSVFESPDFVCLLDRNPEDATSGEIPGAFLDRVNYSFDIPVAHLEQMIQLQEARRNADGHHWEDLEELTGPALTFDHLEETWTDVERVGIPRRMLMLGGMLTDALRLCIAADRSTARPDYDLGCETCRFQGEICSHLLSIPGQRITDSMFRLAQALAWLDGKEEVGTGHLLSAFPWCFSHRLNLRPEHRRETPSDQHWVRNVALEMLRPKLPKWNEALDAYEEGDLETLDDLGDNDLVIRELQVMATERK
jgi:MoxR-like ATPase